MHAYRELLFQFALHILVFLFYSFDKDNPHIHTFHYVFFLNYALAAFIINYLLLPRFYYQKLQLQFLCYSILVIGGVILVEELILEKIYFPDTKGQSFPGLFFTLLEILPVIVILSGVKFAWDALGKQREVDQLKAAIKESELQFLTSQINPHFLFNNLNNLYSYSIENSPKTPAIILELSSVLRYMLYECKEKFVPLSKELEQLENFTRLNQLQIEERGQVHFQADNIPSGYQIAPLILLVFIENAFKHSQSSQTEDIEIDIRIEVSTDGQLNFFCKNSYFPLTNTDNLPHGIGLANVVKRLNLLYPQAHQLDIHEKENRYEVHLSMELSKEYSA